VYNNTTRAGCICGLSVALEDIVAFLYKYSTLNYEKQQRKLCLVLAVLLSTSYKMVERREDQLPWRLECRTFELRMALLPWEPSTLAAPYAFHEEFKVWIWQDTLLWIYLRSQV
jgi:hypothetical protein